MPSPATHRWRRHQQRKRDGNAAAVRRCKLRKRAGLSVLRIEVPLGPLADQLTQDRFLGEWDTENRLARAHEVID